LGRETTTELSITLDGKKVLPLAGISSSTVVACNEIGDYLVYQSDEHGFHNPPGIWKRGTVDIAAVGDSYTLGSCVPSDKNLVAQIRDEYPATLNLGISGNGPLAMLATVKEYLPAERPRVVLWIYYEGNDLTDLEEEKHNPILVRYMEGNFIQGLPGKQGHIDQSLSAFLHTAMQDEVRRQRTELLKLSNLRTAFGLRGLKATIGPMPASEGDCCDIDAFRNILQEAKESAQSWGGKVYFVYLPAWQRYSDLSRLRPAERAREQVLTLVKGLDIPLIDIHRIFEKRDNPSTLFAYPGPDSHYSIEGYRIVGHTVLEFLPATN
jgi:hypothetical protein